MRILLTLCILTIASNLKSQVTVSGVVKNYNDTIFYISETGGFHNFTRVWRDNRVGVIIDKDRRFKAIIPEEAIGAWYIKTEKGNQYFHLIKGQDLELIADFSQAKPLYAIGKNADDFNYSNYVDQSMPDDVYKKYLSGIKSRHIDSVLMYRKEYAQFQKRILDQYRTTYQMSGTYFNWLNSKYSYAPFERTLVENIKHRDSLDDITISKIMEKGINDEYAALNTTEYNDLVDFYVSTKINRQDANATIYERFNFVVDSDILTGSTKDVYLSRFMAWLMKTPDSIYNPLFVKYNQVVLNEEMKQYVINRRNDYATPVGSSSAGVNSMKAGSISEIFKKYKGKVIYIDFWASWCIPCRVEMPNAAVLKEKLKGKDVVFLYFGYNDKEKAWMKARNQFNIEGEHYLLDEKTIREADELFGINGIPHYAIIDKSGSIVSKRAERPGDVYQQLVNLVDK